MKRVWHSAQVFCLVVLLWTSVAGQTMAAPPLQGDPVVHVVQAGETLSAIAQKYDVTVDAIVQANNLADPNRIAVGQRLTIPGVGPTSVPAEASSTIYVVQLGDTLALIARRYNVPLQDLAQTNRLANPNLIYVGQKLVIPAVKGSDLLPTGGQVYVVRAGDTVANIAARYSTTVWAVAQTNGIANPNVIQVGQRLLIPSGEGQSSLPLPFVTIQIIPAVVGQGQTVQVFVGTQGRVSLSGSFDRQPLLFVEGEEGYRTLFGIHPMANPGPYALDLKAVQGDQVVSVHSLVQVVAGSFGVENIVLSDDKSQLLEPTLVAREAEYVTQVTSQATLSGLWQGLFKMPLTGDAPVSARFGTRRSYNGGPATSYHGGIDYDVSEGTPVHSPAHGRVVLAEPLQVRGNAVIVDHGRGVMSCFWHMSRIDVTVGQTVEPGTVLGAVGTTGLSTGPHLHWEVRVGSVQVDPVQWVREPIQ